MISQFFILSSKGDPLIYKDCILDLRVQGGGWGRSSVPELACVSGSLAVLQPVSPRGQWRPGCGRALLPEADGTAWRRVPGCHGNQRGVGVIFWQVRVEGTLPPTRACVLESFPLGWGPCIPPNNIKESLLSANNVAGTAPHMSQSSAPLRKELA